MESKKQAHDGEFVSIVCLSVWFHLIGDDLNREKLPAVCLSLQFHLISFFSKNNGFRAKMYKTLKIDLFIRNNFCTIYFFPRSVFIDIKLKNLLKTFFLVLSLKIKFAGIFIIIFVISASKHVCVLSFKLIGGKCVSEVHPMRLDKWRIHWINYFYQFQFISSKLIEIDKCSTYLL